MARTVRTHANGGATTQAPDAGTMFGGVRAAIGTPPGKRPVILGDEVYLWILVLLEVGAISWGRSVFSRYHGG